MQVNAENIRNGALKKMTFAESMISKLAAGSVAGAVGVSICYPIDFAKTRLQKPMPGEPLYVGLLDVLKNVRARRGVVGWYDGLRANLTGVIPEKGLKLAVFDVARDSLKQPDGTITQRAEATAAVIAAVAQVIVTTPMEIVKIRCQLSGRGALSVCKELGLKGMYKGYVSTLSRDVVFNIVFFPVQSHIKRKCITEDLSESKRLLFSFLAGITAGVLAAAISTPVDVIKTRLQAGDKGNMATVARKIIKTEGTSSLFLGLLPRVTAIAPLFGIAICVYDVQKRFLQKYGYDVP